MVLLVGDRRGGARQGRRESTYADGVQVSRPHSCRFQQKETCMCLCYRRMRNRDVRQVVRIN
eukprot:9453035-Lingulodinium_polyedra.AAC.1